MLWIGVNVRMMLSGRWRQVLCITSCQVWINVAVILKRQKVVSFRNHSQIAFMLSQFCRWQWVSTWTSRSNQMSVLWAFSVWTLRTQGQNLSTINISLIWRVRPASAQLLSDDDIIHIQFSLIIFRGSNAILQVLWHSMLVDLAGHFMSVWTYWACFVPLELVGFLHNLTDLFRALRTKLLA